MKRILLITLLLSVGFCQRLSEVIETYDNGNIKSISYHKKTRDGIDKVKYEEYYKNGKNKLRGNYKDGIRDGLWTFWDYHDGKEYKCNEGEVIDIDEIPVNFNGTLFLWDTDRKGDGKEYIREHVTIKNGKLNGLWTGWDENGQKKEEGTFKDGELISSKEWNKDGSVIE